MTISEVSKLYDMPIDTIRYYERIALMEPVEKDASGRRDYKEKDMRRLRFLKLMRAAGVSIERIKDYVDLFYVGENTLPDRKDILIKQREELQNKINELQNVMNELDYNIEHFDDTLAKWEKMRRNPEQYSEKEVMEVEKQRSKDLDEFMDRFIKEDHTD